MYDAPLKIIVNDNIQQKYVYELTERPGSTFDKNFKPELSPKQMLELGVFGGKYMTDCETEFPKEWFKKARLSPDFANPKLNYFGVTAGQTLKIWQRKGWVYFEDPRGWFQWYCRYYMGRRIPNEDERQIKRWKNMKRHVSQLKKNCQPSNLTCRPKQRQALLQWAYDSRKI
jgi:hypothetical protein